MPVRPTSWSCRSARSWPDVRGTVTLFDKRVGLGEITSDRRSPRPLPLHRDRRWNSRHPGRQWVDFDLLPKLGRYEATHVVAA